MLLRPKMQVGEVCLKSNQERLRYIEKVPGNASQPPRPRTKRKKKSPSETPGKFPGKAFAGRWFSVVEGMFLFHFCGSRWFVVTIALYAGFCFGGLRHFEHRHWIRAMFVPKSWIHHISTISTHQGRESSLRHRQGQLHNDVNRHVLWTTKSAWFRLNKPET